MRYDTAHHRMTKRANDFFGMSLLQYILTFAYMNGDRIVFNENTTMQKAFSVWVSYGDNQEKLSVILQKRA